MAIQTVAGIKLLVRAPATVIWGNLYGWSNPSLAGSFVFLLAIKNEKYIKNGGISDIVYQLNDIGLYHIARHFLRSRRTIMKIPENKTMLSVSAVLIALSLFYYLVIFLPSEAEYERNLVFQEQLEKCLKEAENDYLIAIKPVNEAIVLAKQKGENLDKFETITKTIDKRQAEIEDECWLEQTLKGYSK